MIINKIERETMGKVTTLNDELAHYLKNNTDKITEVVINIGILEREIDTINYLLINYGDYLPPKIAKILKFDKNNSVEKLRKNLKAYEKMKAKLDKGEESTKWQSQK